MVTADDLVGVSLRYSWKILNMDNKALAECAANCARSYLDNPPFGIYNRYDTADKTDTAFLFLDKQGIQNIAIRGTDSLADWLQNLQFIPDPEVREYKAHGGFSRGARELLRQMLPDIHKEIPVRIQGHSLGGAISVLMSMQLELEGFLVDNVVTFGAPRGFDKRGAEFHGELRNKSGQPLASRTTQVRNGNDIVCRVLLSSPAGQIGAWHPYCRAMHVDHAGYISEGAGHWEAVRAWMPNTLDRIHKLKENISEMRQMVTGSVGDHAIDNYYNALNKALIDG